MCSTTLALLLSLTATGAVAETMRFADSEQGAPFDKCIKIEDFTSKTLDDEVEVVARDEGGCCPDGYVPGAKHYNKYMGAQVVCGFKEDGNVAVSTSSSNGAKSCTYNGCYVWKQSLSCKDDAKQLLNGCCAKPESCKTNACAFKDGCLSYTYNFQTAFSNKVDYCLNYNKNYKMENTADKADDIKEGKLAVDNVYVYTPCGGGSAGGGGAAASTKKLSCNVGTKTTYSGCGAGLSDTNTFKETDCTSGGDKCMTLQYHAEGGGCTTASAIGYCITSATDCAYYDKTYKDQPTYKGYECTECDSDNCNTKDTKGGGGSDTTSSNAHGAVTSIALVAAIGIVA